MLRVIRGVAGSGIVYARTRKATEEIAAQLQAEGIAADFYHAGLGFRMRASKQEAWLRGEIRVIVATNAFGMGIDKADVRFVIHDQIPASMEAYYQEAGRAGRDGQPAYAVLLYNEMDAQAARRRIETSYPPLETVRKVYEAIFNHLQVTVGGGKDAVFDFDLMEFSTRFKLFPLTVFNSIKLLELNGYMALTDVLDNPTRIMFRTSREELYKLQVDRTDLDSFLRVLLRLYTGLFTEFVAVDEAYIARMSGYSEARVKELLYQLSVMRVIRYIPRRSSPLLILQEERLPVEDVAIAPATYHRRREMEELRAAAMVEYAENGSQCRSVMLREYFDEPHPEPCGVCDVCLSRRREEMVNENDAYTGIRNELLRILNDLPAGGSITLRALMTQVGGRPMAVLATLRRLLAEGRIRQLNDGGLTLPIVYNCGGYEKPETLRTLEWIVDIYLTDFKYMDAEAARRYSHAPDYPEIVKEALGEMARQQPDPVFDEKGMMRKGVIVRHLLLPGHLKNAEAVVKYVYETYGNRVYLSLMNQYTPLPGMEKWPEINRKVTRREYDRLLDYAVELGVENGFIQEGRTAEESFIPAFDCEGI